MINNNYNVEQGTMRWPFPSIQGLQLSGRDFENLGVFEHQMNIEQSRSKKFQMTSFYKGKSKMKL